MKGNVRILSISLLIVLFSLANVNEIKGTSLLSKPLSTNITKLEWSEYTNSLWNESKSYFLFFAEYRILNPNSYSITIDFPYTVQFKINLTLDLEDSSIVAYEMPWGAFCAISQLTLQPGYTYGNSSTYIVVEEQNVVSLPNGIYTVWVQDCFTGSNESFIFYNETILTVQNEMEIIDYGTTVITLQSGFQLGFIYVICFPFLLIFTKKGRENN